VAVSRIDVPANVRFTSTAEQRQLTIDWIKASVPYQTPELIERFLQGMRTAGLDEA